MKTVTQSLLSNDVQTCDNALLLTTFWLVIMFYYSQHFTLTACIIEITGTSI